MRDLNCARLKRRAAELEQKRQFDKAIECYVQFLETSGSELADEDIALYNRVGDLLARQGDQSGALAYYEKAVDLYAERGYLSSAIALCNKILRQSPGRVPVYYKLGRINARKGFRSDARKNFLEYAERMQQAGEVDEAFRALKEYATLYPDDEEMRLLLADLLSRQNRKGEALEQLRELYEKLEAEGRQMEARATVERMRAIDPSAVSYIADAATRRGAGELVFLDVSDRGEPAFDTRAATPSRPVSAPRLPGLSGLRVTFLPEEHTVRPVAGWQSSHRSLSTREVSQPSDTGDEQAASPNDQLVTTPVHAGSEMTTTQVEHREETAAGIDMPDVEALAPTQESFAEADSIPPGSRLAPLVKAPPLSGEEFAGLELVEVKRTPPVQHDLALPTTLPRITPPHVAAANGGSDRVSPEDPSTDISAADAPLEETLRPERATPPPSVDAPLPRGFEALFGETASLDQTGAAVHRSEEVRPGRVHTPRTALRVEHLENELRALLRQDPENPELHRQLGELLLDLGKRTLGLDSLALALSYYERDGRLDMARRIASELVRVAPEVVKYHRKRAELAVRARDKAELVEAYMDLATAFFKNGEADKAVAVYLRVLALDPEHEAALFALSTLDPERLRVLRGEKVRPARWSEELEAIPEAPVGEHVGESLEAGPGSAAAVELDEPVGGRPADGQEAVDDLDTYSPEEEPGALEELLAPEVTVGPASTEEPQLYETAGQALPQTEHQQVHTPPAAEPSGYVDLGEWLRQMEPPRSTRMVTQDTAPTGDEEADFAEMLRRFKRAVQQNLDVEDYEAHYDLGVAYKEMGLLDEAIAEFQKALRGSQRVRAYEALGQCFVEKGQYDIAAALLQRALDGPGVDDHQLVGVLYLLGFAAEQTGRASDALRYYQRVFAVDIEFRDVAQRIRAMEQQLS
jgi:tetratricopeptide (TPR) repeat protein